MNAKRSPTSPARSIAEPNPPHLPDVSNVMTHKHTRRVQSPNPPAPTVPDHSWAARATALRQDRPAQWTMLAAIASALTTLAGWVAVLVAPGGDVRFSPLFWLLVLPLLPWIWGLQSQAWAVITLWLALVLAPGLALGALFAAPRLLDTTLFDGGSAPLDTPTAMLVILAFSTAFAAAGAVALRRSSLPGAPSRLKLSRFRGVMRSLGCYGSAVAFSIAAS